MRREQLENVLPEEVEAKAHRPGRFLQDFLPTGRIMLVVQPIRYVGRAKQGRDKSRAPTSRSAASQGHLRGLHKLSPGR
jgi:hypothetical protein